MAHPQESATALDEAIRPYTIHVSNKYLDLTRRKLELTRLPHQHPKTKSDDWWEPQATVEPLIDFWLEQFSWRGQERQFNSRVPQFRTAITTAASASPLRLHFIHSRSPHPNAVPLLLIPPFPFTNLSLTHLIGLFTEPDDAVADQPFHLVVPSLPGLGFSDALTNRTYMIPVVAEMLDVLMKRLGYKHFVTTNSGPSVNGLAQVDWRVANHLAIHHPDSCLGAHFVSPPWRPPQFRGSLMGWARWKLASIFQSPILGYSRQDLDAIKRNSRTMKSTCLGPLGFGSDGAYEPNTLAYALCDSPIGLLLFFLMVIRILGPKKDLSPAEMVTIAELTWLPGPEGTMRLWAHCASCTETDGRRRARKPRAALTVFMGDEESIGSEQSAASGLPSPAPNTYSCPAWGSHQYHVVSSNRVRGSPGLLAWERPDIIATGARGLARAILAADGRLRAPETPETASVEQVVVDGVRDVSATAPETLMAAAGDAGGTAQRQTCEVDLETATSTARDASKRSARPVTPQGWGDSEAMRHASDAESSEGSPNTVIAVRLGT